MQDNLTINEKMQQLFQSGREYVENRIELEMLKGTSKIAKTLSAIVAMVLGMVVGLLVLLFACIALAIVLNNQINSSYGGYLIVSGILLIVLILIFTLGRNLIKGFFINTILQNIDDE